MFAEFDRLEALMSVWRDGSDILRLNAAAGDHAVPVSPDVRRGAAGRARRSANGRTAGSTSRSARCRACGSSNQDKDNQRPGHAARSARGCRSSTTARSRSTSGGHGVPGAQGNARSISAASARATPSIAASRSCDARASHDFMIQAGGDLYVAGPEGRWPWRLGIRDPRGPADRSFAALELTDGTFSTSGDYERFFIKDGRRYHHILDPTAGEPARGCRSVTTSCRTRRHRRRAVDRACSCSVRTRGWR